VEVRCRSWKQFLQLYTKDISKGGMFVCVADPPAVDTGLEIRIHLPGDEVLTLAARVAHVVSAERAAAAGERPGVGAQFEDMDDDQRRRLLLLLDIARAEDAKQSPAPSTLRAEDLFSDLADRPQPSETGTHPIADDFALASAVRYIGDQRYVEAQRDLGQLLARDPEHKQAKVWLLIVRARQLKVKGEKEQSLATYRRVLELDQENLEAVREIRARAE
jgi:uncharacterized protein (TIGR02266 family)